jgi:hypothetical protein
MAMAYFEMGAGDGGPDDESIENMRKAFGPGQVEDSLRHAISICWMSLPPDKKNVDEVERQIRRILERTFKALREDEDAFSGEH